MVRSSRWRALRYFPQQKNAANVTSDLAHQLLFNLSFRREAKRQGRNPLSWPREKRYYFYIMSSQGRVLYVGMTGFLTSRVLQHKSGETEGFTSRYHTTRLVYYEVFRYVIMPSPARQKSKSGGGKRKR